MGNHPVQKISANFGIRVDATVVTSTKQSADRPGIVIYYKKKREIILVEVGITSQNQLTILKNEKRRKFYILAHEICDEIAKLRSYDLTWDHD